MKDSHNNKILIVTGSGLSKAMGMPTTFDISNALMELMDIGHAEKPRKIRDRLRELNKYGFNLDNHAEKDFIRTLSILHDGDGAKCEREACDVQDRAIQEYLMMFEHFIPKANIVALSHGFGRIWSNYDWFSLKSIANDYYASIKVKEAEDAKKEPFKIHIADILTIIQNAYNDNISIITKEIFTDETVETSTVYYCDRKRLEGAIKVYKLLIFKLIKHALRKNLSMNAEMEDALDGFFYSIAKDYSGLDLLDSPMNSIKSECYLSHIAYLSYNWDPILPFLGMKINARINKELLAQSGNSICKKVYLDFGVPFSGVAFSGEHKDVPIFTMSQDAAFHIN